MVYFNLLFRFRSSSVGGYRKYAYRYQALNKKLS